jgi:hypothetical protein
MYVWMYVWMYLCIEYVYAYVNVCMYVCMYVHVPSCLEGCECLFTFALGAIAVNGRGGVSLTTKSVLQRISRAFGFHEHQHQPTFHGVQQTNQKWRLVVVLHVLYGVPERERERTDL